MKLPSIAAIIFLALMSCNNNSGSSVNKDSSVIVINDTGRATMYYGGDIITMEGDSAIYAEALVVKKTFEVYEHLLAGK